MKKLLQTVTIRGIGKPGMTAELVERTGNKAWYKRGDDVHEVFKIKIEKEKEVFGRHYPEQEKYPTNEDFGKWAWCFNNEKLARSKYEKI